MFEQTFVDGAVPRRNGWTVLASTTLQLSLLGTAILIPLLNPEMLPMAAVQNITLIAPPPPPPPRNLEIAVNRVTRVVRQVMNGMIFQPLSIPRKAAMIDEPVGPTDPVPGVPSGAGTGVPNGVINGIVDSVQRLNAAPPPPVADTHAKPEPRVNARPLPVGGNVQEAMLINRVIPIYPPIAKAARVSGTVVFHAIIGRDGLVEKLEFVSGHPMLVEAARAAVSQWRYRPTMLNGAPVEVDTSIRITFTLNQ